jgi:hypothetical protein
MDLKKQQTTDSYIAYISASCTVTLLVWILWYCRYGIDFKDEGLYLISIANPFNYSISITQFSFIYHPLYKLLQGNIGLLRQANILMTFSLGWVMVDFFLKNIFGHNVIEKPTRIIISAAFATSSLVFLHIWHLTPSYNWLALQALFITVTGLLIAEKVNSKLSILGWCLIGVGGWLAFMAKPTTAAALGLFSGFYLIGSGKFFLRYLTISLLGFIILLLLSAFLIDGSIVQFIDRLKGAAELSNIRRGEGAFLHTFRFGDFPLGSKIRNILIILTAVFTCTAFSCLENGKSLAAFKYVFSILFSLIILATVFNHTYLPVNAGNYSRGVLIWSIPFAAILIVFSKYRHRTLAKITRAHWSLFMILVAMPYAYVFGTANNYWLKSTQAGLFWVLAGIVFLDTFATNRRLTSLLLCLGLATQMVTAVLVETGIEAPYGGVGSLRKNDYNITIGETGSTLILSKGFGRFFADVTELAKQSGFKRGTPMIDLTSNPSIIFAIGAISPGQAYFMGGLSGSDEVARKALRTASCEDLAIAWILNEPGGKFQISSNILSSFGASMPDDYELVGVIKGNLGADEIPMSAVAQFVFPNKDMQILRPIRSKESSIIACAERRKAQ